MNKIYTLVMMILILGFQISSAQAADFTDIIPDVNFNLCNALTIRGFSSHFTTDDGSISAKLNYNNLKSGDAITGQISDANLEAALIDSHCYNGVIRLSWLQPGFYGIVVGYIDLINKRIARVTGVINGEQVNTNLNFVGYGN